MIGSAVVITLGWLGLFWNLPTYTDREINSIRHGNGFKPDVLQPATAAKPKVRVTLYKQRYAQTQFQTTSAWSCSCFSNYSYNV